MTQFNYIHEHDHSRHPIRHWTRGVHMDQNTISQLRDIANLPFIHKHVAAMPDAHVGKGATVGSVIATKGAVVPSAVGVDIGCGMCAVMTSLRASDLPDNLHLLRCMIEQAVPHGRTAPVGNTLDKGAFNNALPVSHEARWLSLKDTYETIVAKHPKIRGKVTHQHMGTLGGGNHFIEICLDESDRVWVMLHSGSRGVGNRIGQYFIEQAKLEMERYFIGDYLPNSDMAYLVENTEIFDDYVQAVQWGQDYAMQNRAAMLDATLEALSRFLGRPFSLIEKAVNCHHNYIDRENHFGENVWVTRKGAVRARAKDLGIIPGSMGTGSFIVRGLGNKDSFCSCSHGAGRVMSRGEAKRRITMEDHAKAMSGIEARLDEEVLDESPAAYKDIGAVMNAQNDLVEVLYRLRQIVNIKG
ncbi:MAG: RtcB family protein [Planctomycetes bacterium]|nr:RtcB family protein [Planctomycetota bacterium]